MIHRAVTNFDKDFINFIIITLSKFRNHEFKKNLNILIIPHYV